MNGISEEALERFMSQLASEFIVLVPKLILGVVTLVVAFLVLRLVGGAVRKLLSIANIDDLTEKYLRVKAPLSINSIILAIFYAGVILAAVYGLINIFLGETYIELANSLLLYGARVISVIFLAIILFVAFSGIIEKIRVESRMRGYLFFIIMLLLTAMLIDITALSEPVKSSLYTGLAIGIGASLTVFSVWFFFHEYFERLLERPSRRKS